MGLKNTTKSISLNPTSWEMITEYADKYMQGNISAAVGFMCIKFIEDEDTLRHILENVSCVGTTLVKEEVTKTEKAKEKRKNRNMDNIDLLNSL